MILDENGRPLVAVFSCYSDAEAALAVSFLDAYGIVAQVNSEVPHSVLPVTVGKLGRVRVLVSEDDAEAALGLLEEVHGGQVHLEGDGADSHRERS
jgi:hypothetical protein